MFGAGFGGSVANRAHTVTGEDEKKYCSSTKRARSSAAHNDAVTGCILCPRNRIMMAERFWFIIEGLCLFFSM